MNDTGNHSAYDATQEKTPVARKVLSGGQNLLSATSEKAAEVDLVALSRTIMRGKWRILLTILIANAFAFFYVFQLATPTYTGKSVVALDSRKPQVTDIKNVVSSLGGDQATINTEVQVLRSRSLMGRVVESLNLTEDPEFNKDLTIPPKWSVGGLIRELKIFLGAPEQRTPDQQLNATIDELSDAISVSNIRQSFVFELSAVTQSPEKSMIIANELANLYLESQLEAKFDGTQRATKWLTERVAELQIELEQAEQDLKAFEARTKLVSPEVLAAQERQVKDLRERTVDAETNFAVAKNRIEALKAAADDPQEIITLSADPILRRISNAQGVDSPQFQARVDQILQQAETDAERAERQALILQNSITDLTEGIKNQASELVELRQLEREAEASTLIYEFFLTRLKETSVQQGIQQADARILSLAVPPLRSTSPRLVRTVILFTLFGALLGAAMVAIRETLLSVFRTTDELEEATGYEVIGQIPTIGVRKREKIKDYLVSRPTSAAVESIRNLRTTLLLQNVDNPPQVIMSTSSMPSEGKTTQSVGLAINLAQMGRKVLLIEGDIRRRVFGDYFEIPFEQGIVSVLTGETELKDATFHDEKLKIDVLQGESSRVNAADLYSSDRFKEFIAKLREEYDNVIFDTPPVLLVPDARITAPYVDAIMYAVKWDSTPKAQVRRGLQMFESVGVNVSGLVLTQVDPKGLKSYGYGDYGSSSAYYDN